MKNKKGLVISWYFPPINSSEGLCTFKLLKNSKFEYDVYTQKNNKSWSYDTNEDKLTSKNINPVFSETDDIGMWVEEGVNRFKNKLNNYNFIMSRSMAPESHEIALELKKINPNIPWIASFGDPITNNPYMKLIKQESPYKVKGNGILSFSVRYIFSPKRILKNLLWNYKNKKYINNHTRIKKDELLQNDVFKNADIIIFNNEYQKEYMLNGYPQEIRDKSLILPHGYDVDFYNKGKIRKNNKYVISYLGHLDDIRTPKNFLIALNRLKHERKEIYDNLEINIYGNMSDKDKIYLVDNDLCDVVKFKKPIKYFESLEVMRQSDLLLLIDANLGLVNSENIFYAAKLADYIGSGSSIFGITMQDGASADIIKENGGVISSHSVDDIYNNLVMILEGKKKIKIIDKNKKYDMKNIANKYDERIVALIEDNK